MVEGSEQTTVLETALRSFWGARWNRRKPVFSCFLVTSSNYSKWGWNRSQDYKGLSSDLNGLKTEHLMELCAEETKEVRDRFETARSMLLKVEEPKRSQGPENSVVIITKIGFGLFYSYGTSRK